MNENFNDFPWHDSSLESIYMDRSNPGEKDVVQIIVKWPLESGTSTIVFTDCYGMTATMNFGIIACESILTAECLTDSEELTAVRNRLSWYGADFSELKCYRIETNSTASIIKIFAFNFQITTGIVPDIKW
jgi:hypothetical protein